MTEATVAMLERLAGLFRRGDAVAGGKGDDATTLRIVGQTLFSLDLDRRSAPLVRQ